ncbi:malonyl CoA-acyl carrier protein transacylase [Rothia aeria]|uniref:[acyl-carrier-protein] S-malonyltransferase n=1 Tax=Rothia aeria TaxID=172042 RepID=A0A2Z5R3S2_9MICC|nr:malonyl CoA-acyl carrier protein transacylase [Rothia aeria]
MRALVCPGQGSQKKSFLSPWLEIDGVREHLQRLSDAAGIDLIHYGTEAEEETIKDTAIAQPLIVAAGIVTGRKVLQKLGESKLILAGHSVGEITAAALAGVLTEEDAMRFVRVRATGMAQAAAASPTGMAAVLGGVEQDVRQAIDEAALVAANSNGAGQIVAAGPLKLLRRSPPTRPPEPV